MKKFVKWILNCDWNRVEAFENFGFCMTIVFLTLGFFSQYLASSLPLAICNVFITAGLIIWGLGMLWSEIRERYEGYRNEEITKAD